MFGAGSSDETMEQGGIPKGPRRVVEIRAGPILKDSEARDLIALIYEHSGIVLTLDKKNLISSRLNKRLRKLGLRSFRQIPGLPEVFA